MTKKQAYERIGILLTSMIEANAEIERIASDADIFDEEWLWHQISSARYFSNLALREEAVKWLDYNHAERRVRHHYISKLDFGKDAAFATALWWMGNE